MAATRLCRGLFPSSSSVKIAAKGIRKTGVYNVQRQICVRVILCLFLRHQLFLVRVIFVLKCTSFHNIMCACVLLQVAGQTKRQYSTEVIHLAFLFLLYSVF